MSVSFGLDTGRLFAPSVPVNSPRGMPRTVPVLGRARASVTSPSYTFRDADHSAPMRRRPRDISPSWRASMVATAQRQGGIVGGSPVSPITGALMFRPVRHADEGDLIAVPWLARFRTGARG
jgi:hypothetical protein